jgi:hypothetical protein
MKRFVLWSVIPAAFLLVLAGCQQSTVEGPDKKKLTLKKPMDVTIKRGDTNQVTVSIDRGNFRDPVSVSFDNLPKGVTVQDKDTKINSGDSSAKFTLKAADDAELVTNHETKATVTGPDGIKVTEPFKVTVKDKS